LLRATWHLFFLAGHHIAAFSFNHPPGLDRFGALALVVVVTKPAGVRLLAFLKEFGSIRGLTFYSLLLD
jgi:hypothetical protein